MGPLGRGIVPKFGLLLWMIWKDRAQHVFQDIEFSLHHVFTAALRLQLDHHHSRASNRSLSVSRQRGYQILQVCWSPPPPHWVKCNSDGSVCGAMREATCGGGVCRDEFGQWVFGFCYNIGTSTVLWAELWE
ncbi:uncharacterized protein LOC130736056 [Lotus japonicus]|uniref:uncharacterized protein LOC130736056 n=1 Tax=Lotus japonicus TaxID=34305 RepID=UPI00258F924C|nr:uncharacterized protein LOC130736056 [Lotus japonicus]